MQLLPSLLSELQAVCAGFPDARKGRGGNIAIADFGVSAFAMFFMQSASFLAYQRTLEKGHGRSNCQTLFGIGRIPSDNYIRDMLDEADPVLLQPCFERLETLLAEAPMRQAFGRLGGRTLIAWDGTEYFCSQKLGCPHCLTRKRANGKIENYHTMLAATGDDFIFTCKESSYKALYDFIAGAEPERHQEQIRKGRTVETRRYRWIEGVPVRDGKDAALVNWIGFEIVNGKGRVKYSMAWVTSLPVNKNNVAEIAACGRARWKIENEAFNVMKNHGYELEHNFGHGETFLAMMLAALNLLAFAWHAALDLLEPPWQAAREAAAKRTSFFAHLLTLTTYVGFPSWAVFLEAHTTFTIPPELLKTQKIE